MNRAGKNLDNDENSDIEMNKFNKAKLNTKKMKSSFNILGRRPALRNLHLSESKIMMERARSENEKSNDEGEF